MITKVLYIAITLLIAIFNICIGTSIEQYNRDEDTDRNAKFIGILFIINLALITTGFIFM